MNAKKMIQYRDVWMGIAMLCIIAFHSGISFPIGVISKIQKICYGGVDIFLFASGIGNYYSYTRDQSPLPFLQRRVLRLAPAYMPFIVVWCIYKIAIGDLSPWYFIGNLFGVQAISNAGPSFNWYLAALIVCYISTPYLSQLIKNSNLYRCILVVLFLIIISSAFWCDPKFIIVATRLPIYVMGMICAKYDFQVIKKKYVILGAISFLIGLLILFVFIYRFPKYLWLYGMYWYPFILITPFSCFIISYISILLERIKVGYCFLEPLKWVSRISFEVYLVHVAIFEELPALWERYSIQEEVSNTIRFILIVLSFVIAYFLHYIAKLIRDIFIRITKPENGL